MEQLLDAEGVAALVGVQRSTIHSYVSRGLMPPPARMFGRTPVWAPDVITQWLSERPGRGWHGPRSE